MSGLEQDPFEDLIKAHKPKSDAQLMVEKLWPDLPNAILKDYTAEQWLWLSDREKANLINYGQARTGSLDPWSQMGDLNG